MNSDPTGDTPPDRPDADRVYALELRKLDLERFKAKLAFRKSVLIGGFVAVAIALIPPLFQFASSYLSVLDGARKRVADNEALNRELERKKAEFKSTYVSAFLTNALNQDIEIRLRLAEYFEHVAPTDERSDWSAYYDALKTKRDSIRIDIETEEADLARRQASPKEQQDLIEQDRLIQHLSWLRGEVGYVAMDRSVIRDPRSPATVTSAPATVPLDWVEPGRRAMAQKIATAFAEAGMGASQQIAAVVDAIAESNLNPSAVSSNSFGLFQLSQHGFGAGYSQEQLLDPDLNIALTVQGAKRVASFVNAANVTDAITQFVTRASRPINPSEAIRVQLEIAKRAQP